MQGALRMDQQAGPLRQERHGAVLVLVIDAPPVNALGHALRAGLWQAIAAAEADATVGAVLIRAAGRTFPAGADISEFGQPPRAPQLPDLCDRIEACPKPVLAAIHGTALGGGLELALAAHARIARADAMLGLPEVRLGILPGAGGTQRVPRLIGAEQALRLMLTGKPVSATEALALGLLDGVVEDGLEVAALRLAEGLVGRRLTATRDRREGMRDGAAYQTAVAAARLAQAGARLPAGARIVDCVEAAQLLPIEQGMVFERAAFADLVATPEAAGLRHAFFAERAAARFPEAKVEARPVAQLGVIGAAGSDLALLALQAGCPVVLVEPNRPQLVEALERIAAAQETAVQEGRLTPAARDADWERLTPALGAAALADSDLVLVADAALLAEAAEAAPPGAVLALTGRGALPDSPRASDMIGLRLVGGRLAELAVGPQTAPEAVATARAVARRLGLLCLRAAAPGGIAGRVMLAGRAAVTHLLAQGEAPARVAGALRGFGLPQLAPEAAAEASETGASAGRIIARVLSAMANEGARLLERGIAQRASDIDFALVAGLGFPRWQGGPMFWADQRGLLILRRDLAEWGQEAPEIWAMAPLIADLAAQGGHFADHAAQAGSGQKDA